MAEFLSLEAAPGRVAAAYAVLAPDERMRADRLDDIKRRRFIIARAGVRSAVAARLGVEPEALSFTYGHQGKPSLDGDPCPLYFSAAHARDLAVVATTTAGPIGVDLERLDRALPWEGIAARYFTPWERAAIAEVSDGERRAAFIRTWVRKEAYVKALGDGISPAFREAEVTVTEGECRLRQVGTPGDSPAHWMLADLSAPAGHLAAVAVREA
jgi:4'-phosphopantetheinyl transferase